MPETEPHAEPAVESGNEEKDEQYEDAVDDESHPTPTDLVEMLLGTENGQFKLEELKATIIDWVQLEDE